VGGGVYSVGGGVSAPIPIYKPEPAYSEEARKAKYQGTVVLWITVDAAGGVTDCRVVKPLGLGLDEKAVETVRTWKFKPALRSGTPVPVRVMVEVSFRLF
jgi:TonB family protein